jgi:hypothetical protein
LFRIPIAFMSFGSQFGPVSSVQYLSGTMQPFTFPCPNCGRRVGIGLELLGKSVRCPHCRQVVVAPTATPSKGPTPSPFSEADDHLPRFAPPPREGAESIFGEAAASEDSLFEAPTAHKPVLVPDTDDGPSPRSSGLIDFNSKEEPKTLRPADAVESADLARSLIESPEPRVQKDLSQPDFAILAQPAPRPERPATHADDVVDPFTKFGRLNATAPPAPRSAAPPTTAPAPPRPRYFWPLVAYALAATAFAAWGWLRPAPHPFATIPDFFGQYHAADRKKVAALPVDLNRPFPAELTVKLGGTLRVGELDFEPLAIEERRTRWEVKADGGRPPRDIDCLVLTARVRNRSARPFHPFDPAFNRYAAPDDPAPLSAVVVAGERYPGGPIPWPFRHAGREFIPGQEADERPLEPGQERVSVLPAIDGDKGKKLLARLRSSTGPALWIVHLRRGFTTYGGETVPVSALVGVEFDASQIGKTAKKSKSG